MIPGKNYEGDFSSLILLCLKWKLQLQKRRYFERMTAFQNRNVEYWGTSLETAFSKIFLRFIFSIEKKDPTKDHTTPFQDRMVAGSLQYHWVIEKLKLKLQGIKIVQSCVKFLRNVRNHFLKL
jgi:hypothetical protein